MTLALVTMLGWIFNMLDLVNFLVIHNEMIATNGLLLLLLLGTFVEYINIEAT